MNRCNNCGAEMCLADCPDAYCPNGCGALAHRTDVKVFSGDSDRLLLNQRIQQLDAERDRLARDLEAAQERESALAIQETKERVIMINNYNAMRRERDAARADLAAKTQECERLTNVITRMSKRAKQDGASMEPCVHGPFQQCPTCLLEQLIYERDALQAYCDSENAARADLAQERAARERAGRDLEAATCALRDMGYDLIDANGANRKLCAERADATQRADDLQRQLDNARERLRWFEQCHTDDGASLVDWRDKADAATQRAERWKQQYINTDNEAREYLERLDAAERRVAELEHIERAAREARKQHGLVHEEHEGECVGDCTGCELNRALDAALTAQPATTEGE